MLILHSKMVEIDEGMIHTQNWEMFSKETRNWDALRPCIHS